MQAFNIIQLQKNIIFRSLEHYVFVLFKLSTKKSKVTFYEFDNFQKNALSVQPQTKKDPGWSHIILVIQKGQKVQKFRKSQKVFNFVVTLSI
jgi:hypothetical protein